MSRRAGAIPIILVVAALVIGIIGSAFAVPAARPSPTPDVISIGQPDLTAPPAPSPPHQVSPTILILGALISVCPGGRSTVIGTNCRTSEGTRPGIATARISGRPCAHPEFAPEKNKRKALRSAATIQPG